MDPLTMTAASGLRSRLESLDILSNNLANSATSGYKRDSEFYGLYMSKIVTEENADLDPATPALPFIEKPWTDYSQGLVTDTGNPADFAISGKGFFEVQGPSGPLYTRNGRFRLTSSGEVQTVEGYALRLEGGGPLRVAPGHAFQVASDGTVTQGPNAIGRIRVAVFADNSKLSKFGHSYFRSDTPPAPAQDYELLQGKSESSNVAVAESAVRLVNLTRQYEMLNRAATMCGEMGRRAIEEVGRVGS